MASIELHCMLSVIFRKSESHVVDPQNKFHMEKAASIAADFATDFSAEFAPREWSFLISIHFVL